MDEILTMANKILPSPVISKQIEVLEFVYNDLHMSPKLIEYFLEYCANKKRTVFSYMRAIAMNWHERGFTIVQQVQDFENRLHNRKVSVTVNTNKFVNFEQRTDDLDAIVQARIMNRSMA